MKPLKDVTNIVKNVVKNNDNKSVRDANISLSVNEDAEVDFKVNTLTNSDKENACTKQNLYQCPLCSKTFKSKSSLGSHTGSHTKKKLLQNATSTASTTITDLNATPTTSTIITDLNVTPTACLDKNASSASSVLPPFTQNVINEF